MYLSWPRQCWRWESKICVATFHIFPLSSFILLIPLLLISLFAFLFLPLFPCLLLSLSLSLSVLPYFSLSLSLSLAFFKTAAHMTPQWQNGWMVRVRYTSSTGQNISFFSSNFFAQNKSWKHRNHFHKQRRNI